MRNCRDAGELTTVGTWALYTGSIIYNIGWIATVSNPLLAVAVAGYGLRNGKVMTDWACEKIHQGKFSNDCFTCKLCNGFFHVDDIGFTLTQTDIKNYSCCKTCLKFSLRLVSSFFAHIITDIGAIYVECEALYFANFINIIKL